MRVACLDQLKPGATFLYYLHRSRDVPCHIFRVDFTVGQEEGGSHL
jgi:hypothetical protein